MKRIIALALCLFMILVLTACKSEEAKRVDKMIDDIGTVTLDSEEAISEAEHAVVSLDTEDRDQLENIDKLKEKRKEYTLLVNQEKVENVESLIDSIGEVSLTNTEKLEEAKTAYNALPKEAKELVSNYNIIEEAESTLSTLRVDKVIALIDGIGTVTKESEEKIKEAEEAYKALSSDEQNKVTNYSKLTDARTELTSLKKSEVEERKDNALAKLDKHFDDVTGLTYYMPSVTPEYVNDRSYVLAYLGGKDDDMSLFIRTDYVGDDWIFYDTLIINADGKTYTKKLNYSDITHDNGGGQVWEFYNQQANTSDIDWLKAIANADKAVVRFTGKYQYDLTISESDKKAIGNAVEAYEAVLEYTLYDVNEALKNY